MRTSAVIALTLLLHACAARSTPVLPPSVTLSASNEARLRQDLDEIFKSQSVQHALWGVSIYSPRDGRQLYDLNAERFMVPASNQKILTVAAAAERLGWDYRFTTRIFATGPLDTDGTLTGDLIIKSDGDPTINPRHPARWRAFDDWAAALKTKGVRIISGHVIGDDNAFAEPGWGIGWAWDDLQHGFGAPIGALQYNENQIELLIGPAMTPGARAIISTSPLGSGLFIDHGVTTAPAGSETHIDIARIPGATALQVRGQIAADAKPQTITAAVDNPTRLYLNAFREALGRHGIFVSGSMLDIDDLNVAPNLESATELIVDLSPPLIEIIDVTMKWSRNGYAETLLLTMAPRDEPATSMKGLQAVRDTLAGWGIASDLYLPRDGSGLSRYDYVTADVLRRLLQAIAHHPKHAEPFRSTLPVGGVSGTLATRMKGTPAEGRVVAKTGTLSNVRALSGYLTTLDDQPLIFSILANNFRVSNAEIDALVDKALVRLVQFTRN